MRFAVDSCIRGYHIFKNIWPAPIGEVLQCQPELGNIHDPYCVAVVTVNNTTVGHVPRAISAVCGTSTIHIVWQLLQSTILQLGMFLERFQLFVDPFCGEEAALFAKLQDHEGIQQI